MTLDLTWSANIVFASAGFSGWETVKTMPLSLLFSVLLAGQSQEQGAGNRAVLGMKNRFERTKSGGEQTVKGQRGLGGTHCLPCPSKEDLRAQK